MKARVLFVDDESRVLDGVQRMMRRARDEWTAHAAVGGVLAQSIVDEEPFDFVVSDMRMPTVDGCMLLAHVRARSPGTVRMVLSGQTELDSAIRAVLLAHQFLSKPCSSTGLLGALEKTWEALSRVPDPDLREKIVSIGMLPTRRAVHAAVLDALTATTPPSLDEIAGAVAQDVGMRVKLTQVVASSFFGTGRPVRDVREVVGLLGPKLLKTLVEMMASYATDDVAAPSIASDGDLAEAAGRLTLETTATTSNAVAAGVSARDVGAVLLSLWGIS